MKNTTFSKKQSRRNLKKYLHLRKVYNVDSHSGKEKVPELYLTTGRDPAKYVTSKYDWNRTMFEANEKARNYFGLPHIDHENNNEHFQKCFPFDSEQNSQEKTKQTPQL